MPATIEAILVFTVMIAPGYLLTQGIVQGRNVDAQSPDLHVLAKAVVASAIWLLLTWWWATEGLVRWLGDDSVDLHSPGAIAWRAAVLILAPYAVGRLLGEAVERGWFIAPLLRYLGIASARGNPWDFAWQQVQDAGGPVLVTITLDNGTKVTGQFASDSRATVSPQPPEVYLEEAYEQGGSGGGVVVFDKGVHVPGSQIAAITFKTI